MDNDLTPRPHYRRPGWFTRNVFNRSVAFATRHGLSVWGSRVLEIPGRRSGQPRQNPVNLLTFDGGAFLVSARGHTEWTRNLRANDLHLTLIKGRERTAWVASEVTGADTVPVLRAYLARWRAEVGIFFDGVGPDSTDEELARVAADHPVFALTPAV